MLEHEDCEALHEDEDVALVLDVVLPLEQLMHDDCAVDDWYLPAGQVMQYPEEVRPDDDEYLPAEHKSQYSRSFLSYLPAEHWVQPVRSFLSYLPAPHV